MLVSKSMLNAAIDTYPTLSMSQSHAQQPYTVLVN